MFFFHGLESGPRGSKFRMLSDAFGHIEAPDFRGIDDLDARLSVAEFATRGRTGLVVVGSSFGGLVAALLANEYPERVRGYVLCAPALNWAAGRINRVPPKAVVIHGDADDVIPIQTSIEFCERFGVSLVRVPDDHRLKNSVPQILDAVNYVTQA